MNITAIFTPVFFVFSIISDLSQFDNSTSVNHLRGTNSTDDYIEIIYFDDDNYDEYSSDVYF